MRNTLFSLLKFIIGWPISFIALFFIFKILLPQFKIVIAEIKTLNIFLLLSGVLCFNLFYYLRAFIWKILLKENGLDIPLKEVAILWEMAELKRFVPGNIWSFAGKALSFSEKGVRKEQIPKLLLLESEFFIISCLLVSILSFSYLFGKNLYTLYLSAVVVFIVLIFVFISAMLLKTKLFFLSKLQSLFPHFEVYTNLKIIFISALSLIFFGLGTFFSILSITALNAQIIIPLIGFFVFSLFVGYISFVTPMGLGVRETVLIWGLSKIMTVQMASLSSVFSRLILIFSEIIFLISAYLWKNIKNKLFLKFENFISKNTQIAILTCLVLVYIGYFTLASFQRYNNFHTGRFDLGNMDQTVWNTKNGNIFQLTNPDGTEIVSRLSIHSDFILILLAPFYFIWEDPRMLLLLQSFILGIGAYFVYFISLKILKERNISLIFSFSYLMNPFIQYANLYDFHAVTLATTFLLGSFYFLKVKKYLLFILMLFLSALTKEQVLIIAALFGLYVFLIEKKKLLGATIFIISCFFFYYLIWHAIPQARGGNHFALAYYSDLGESPGKIIKNLFISPIKTANLIFIPKNIEYIKMLFWPTGFLSAFSPVTLMFALPDLLINTLSSNRQLSDIYYQYASTIVPFIYISSIYGASFLKKKFPYLKNFYIILILTSFSAAYLYGPLPGAKKPSLDMFVAPYKNRKEILSFLSSLPRTSAIAATNNLGAHLSHREKIYVIPNGLSQADYVLFLLNDKYARPSLEFQIQLSKKLKNDKDYLLIYENNDFVAFKKLQ